MSLEQPSSAGGGHMEDGLDPPGEPAIDDPRTRRGLRRYRLRSLGTAIAAAPLLALGVFLMATVNSDDLAWKIGGGLVGAVSTFFFGGLGALV